MTDKYDGLEVPKKLWFAWVDEVLKQVHDQAVPDFIKDAGHFVDTHPSCAEYSTHEKGFVAKAITDFLCHAVIIECLAQKRAAYFDLLLNANNETMQ